MVLNLAFHLLIVKDFICDAFGFYVRSSPFGGFFRAGRL